METGNGVYRSLFLYKIPSLHKCDKGGQVG